MQTPQQRLPSATICVSLLCLCRNTPKLLFRLALALYAVGPLVVYAVPDNSTPLIALQAIVALASLVGGTAAFGGASLLNSLQTDRVA